MKLVEELLRATTGLDSASVGASSVHRAVRLRMKSQGLKRLADYHLLLERSDVERSELIESVVVRESWFFRDSEAFTSLARLVSEEWQPAHPASTLRVLSLPCASGEEPFSIAMALLDANLPVDRFYIEGVDISARALERARRGLFGRNSFRGNSLGFRKKYFQFTKEGFVLDATVRESVHLRQGNLLAGEFAGEHGAYDFIFCRNLLIYFDRATQQKALDKVRGLLTPSGVLFVGPAEHPIAIANGFVSAQIPLTFACRKAEHPVLTRRELSHHTWAEVEFGAPPRLRQAQNPSLPRQPATAKAETPTQRDGGRATPAQQKVSGNSIGLQVLLNADLESARRLADAGRLAEAAELCQTFLRLNGPSAAAYYLLGLVCDAEGDPSAIEHYRRAVYLEPNHYEALLQMALWSQKKGDSASARTLKGRAQRAKGRAAYTS